MFKHGLLLLTVLAAGCSVAGRDGGTSGSDGIGVRLGTTQEAMVGGTVSPSTQDSVVFVMQGQEESCSGTLIAPNLVLTARHCVATPDESQTTECVGYGATVDPSTMTIKLGASASWDVGDVAGTGVKIYTPATMNMCGFDIALIQLAADVPGAQISPMRFTDLAKNEATVTVGYGVDGNNNTLPSRMQRSTTVLGVGPSAVTYTEEDGTVFNYTAPAGDVVTGESTCFGDSGGPLFDMKGNVVAMTSRGPLNAPTGGDHGNSCIDMVSIYAGAKFNEAIIRQAAIAAGHPLPATPVASTQSTTPTSKTTGDVGDVTGDDDDSTGDDTGTTKKSTKKAAAAPPATIASSSCSAAPGRSTNGASAWLLVAGVALVITAKRRKNRA